MVLHWKETSIGNVKGWRRFAKCEYRSINVCIFETKSHFGESTENWKNTFQANSK